MVQDVAEQRKLALARFAEASQRLVTYEADFDKNSEPIGDKTDEWAARIREVGDALAALNELGEP